MRSAGVSLDSLAKKYSLSRDSIHRHMRSHVSDDARASYLLGPAQLADLHSRAAEEGGSVLSYLQLVRNSLLTALTSCAEAGDARGTAAVSGALLSCLERLGKLTGEIASIANSVTVNNNLVLQHPDFIKAQTTILRALSPWPDARMAVASALREIDGTPEIAALPPPTKTIELTPCPY